MKALLRLIPAAAIAILGIAAPAHAQDGIDQSTMDAYGGTYYADCAKLTGARLTIHVNSVEFSDGKTHLVCANPMVSASFYGPDQPETFRFVILSDVPGSDQFRFAFHEDKFGAYVVLDPDTKVMPLLSPAARKATYRRCDGNGRVQANHPASEAAPAPAPAKAGATTGVMLKDRKFKSAYMKALGPLANEPWLALLDGPSPETRNVKLLGTDYQLVSACKTHDCHDYSTVLLYSAAGKKLYGHVHRAGRTTLLGAPTSEMAKELKTLWEATFRAND